MHYWTIKKLMNNCSCDNRSSRLSVVFLCKFQRISVASYHCDNQHRTIHSDRDSARRAPDMRRPIQTCACWRPSCAASLSHRSRVDLRSRFSVRGLSTAAECVVGYWRFSLWSNRYGISFIKIVREKPDWFENRSRLIGESVNNDSRHSVSKLLNFYSVYVGDSNSEQHLTSCCENYITRVITWHLWFLYERITRRRVQFCRLRQKMS